MLEGKGLSLATLAQELPILYTVLEGKKLEKKGIENRPLFGCVPTQQPAYSYLKKEYDGKIPNAEYAGKNAFYIGCHQYLNQDDLEYIVGVFDKIFS